MHQFTRQPDWHRTGLAALAIVAMTPVIVTVRYRWPELVIPCTFLAVLPLVLSSAARRSSVTQTMLRWLGDPVAWFGLAVLLWFVSSIIWAADRSQTGIESLKLLGILYATCLIIAVFRELTSERLFVLSVAFVLAGLVIAIFSAVTDGVIHRAFGCCRDGLQAERTGAAATLVVLIWPCIGWLIFRRRRNVALATIALAVILICVSHSGASGLGLLAGLVTVAVGLARPRLAVAFPFLIVLAGFAVALLLGDLRHFPPPFDLLDHLEAFHAKERADIWTYYTSLFWQRPWTGYGFGAERIIGQFPQSSAFTSLKPPANAQLHPHNGPLQILVEFGTIGALLTIAFVSAATVRIRGASQRWPMLPFMAASASAYVTASMVNFGIWEWWWCNVMAVAVILSVQLARIVRASGSIEAGPARDTEASKSALVSGLSP